MPTYQYICKSCRFELEEFQSIKDSPLTLCPSCGQNTLVRNIGGGAGLVFKGSGFYLTDYKKSSTSPSSPSKPSAPKGDTPPATPPSGKPAPPKKNSD
ncbi:MAG TPA: zinc ribbon domain-containing protein [Bacteroidota bacterium]|nr:zinc ribbon domain-containing protein [Bacteroidota bacterium]